MLRSWRSISQLEKRYTRRLKTSIQRLLVLNQPLGGRTSTCGPSMLQSLKIGITILILLKVEMTSIRYAGCFFWTLIYLSRHVALVVLVIHWLTVSNICCVICFIGYTIGEASFKTGFWTWTKAWAFHLLSIRLSTSNSYLWVENSGFICVVIWLYMCFKVPMLCNAGVFLSS